jgi:hypothetical protein
MKKIVSLFAVFALAGLVNADTFTWTSDVLLTNGQISISADLPVAGYLDKVEVWNSTAGMTSAVTIASYAGATAADTFVNLAAVGGTTPSVVRPRVIGTTTAGANLAAAVLATGDNSTNLVTTFLAANYEPIMLGGNTRVKVTGTVAATNTVTVRLFFKRD